MTDRQVWGRPPGYGHQWQPQEQRWQPPQYDPDAHLRRIQGLRPDPWRQPPPSQRSYPAQRSPEQQYQPRQQWQQPECEQDYPPEQDEPWQQSYARQQVPWQPQPVAPVHRQPRRGRDFVLLAVAGAIAAAAIAAVAIVGSPSRPVAEKLVATPVAAQAVAEALGPLALGHFPQTADGRLARSTCEAWSGLRQDYAARLATDSRYQLTQWFSGPAWRAARADRTKLGNDPAYRHIETAFSVATAGDAASIANARVLDKACEAAD